MVSRLEHALDGTHLLFFPQAWQCGRAPANGRRPGPLESPTSPLPPAYGHRKRTLGRQECSRRNQPSLSSI